MGTVVYEWRREDGSPYYVGIGGPQRPYTRRRTCGPPPPRDRIVILYENLDWEEACKIEKELIALYGRRDLGTGILRNLTDGGDGAIGLSKEKRERISKARKGRKHTEESKEKMSKSRLGEKNPNYGKTRSRETKEKISKANRGRKLSEETKRKMSEYRKGRKRSKEAIEKTSGRNSPRYIPRDWHHPIYGEVLKTSLSDLIKMYPEQNLSRGNLSQVANGKRTQHKGWRIFTSLPPTV